MLVAACALGGYAGVKIAHGPREAVAAAKAHYKVVSIVKINSPQSYEKLLNDMADQGWNFDHILGLSAAFKREN